MKTRCTYCAPLFWKTLFFFGISLFALMPLFAQTALTIRGSIGKSGWSSDPNKIIVYGVSSQALQNTVFENINFCISLPDQGVNNPVVQISRNFIPNLEWTYAGLNFPDVVDGRAYYTFIGNEKDTSGAINWPANTEQSIVELRFNGGIGSTNIQLNDLTEAGGIGAGGGPSFQSFWYVQINTLGDVTDYAHKFFKSSGSGDPINGGLYDASQVETLAEILLPVEDRKLGEWLLFPNPTADRLHVVPAYSGNVIIHILDLKGRLMIEHRRIVTFGNAFMLGCQDFIPGTYILELRTPENRILLTRKVMIK